MTSAGEQRAEVSAGMSELRLHFQGLSLSLARVEASGCAAFQCLLSPVLALWRRVKFGFDLTAAALSTPAAPTRRQTTKIRVVALAVSHFFSSARSDSAAIILHIPQTAPLFFAFQTVTPILDSATHARTLILRPFVASAGRIDSFPFDLDVHRHSSIGHRGQSRHPLQAHQRQHNPR